MPIRNLRRFIKKSEPTTSRLDDVIDRLLETSVRLARMNTMLIEAQQISGLGTWSYDVGSGEVVWSKELYRILGQDPNLPPPGFEQQHQLFSQTSWEELCRAVERAINEGCPYEVELEILRPDGRPCWARARGEVSRTSGDSKCLIGTLQDITEFKRWKP